MWAFRDLARYHAEMQALASLQADTDWLAEVKWRMSGDFSISVDVDIVIDGKVFPVVMRFSDVHPDAPPSVKPREATERWSSHQYGPSGELCLQYRADNWVSSITGADVLRSVYTLLATERTTDAGGRVMQVPSNHRVSLGQELRSEDFRFVQTVSLMEKLGQIEGSSPGRFTVRYEDSVFVTWLIAMTTREVEWLDPGIPSGAATLRNPMPGFVTRMADAEIAKGKGSAKAWRTRLLDGAQGMPEFTEDEIHVVSSAAGLRVAYLSFTNDSILDYAMIPPDPGTRLDPAHESLATKTVGILGCGSVGSKVAAMLVRAGVKAFVLVDDDILRPENMIRHELDWSFVGLHKAKAVALRLKRLDTGVSVDVRQQRLGGQESSGSLHGTMAALSRCDCIIDASGSDIALNYAQALFRAKQRPVVWGRVFGGGLGGEVVRCRPGIEPSPQVARARILQWCEERGVEVPKQVKSYETDGEQGPMIADDADVTVIAAHLARLSIDTLLGRDPSHFGASAYLIGLARWWIFDAAFETWPIDLGDPEPPDSQDQMDDAQRAEAMKSLMTIFASS